MTLSLITGTNELAAAIESISRRGKKLDRDIQVAAVSAMAHHAQHGDVTLINRLIEVMPKGARVNALREFIIQFGKVNWDTEEKVFKHDATGTFEKEGAIGTSWTEFKPEPEYKPFDALKAISAMVKRIDSADPERGDRVDDKQAAAIKKLAVELGAETA